MNDSLSMQHANRLVRELTQSKQQGLAMIEVAISLPFLLVMLMATAEFSRAFYEYNTLTKGVRDAARFAVEDAYDGTKQFKLLDNKKAQARNIVVYGNIAGSGAPVLKNLQTTDVHVDQLDLGAEPTIREHVWVRVTYNFQPLANVIPAAGFLSGDVGLNFNLFASSTMRAL